MKELNWQYSSQNEIKNITFNQSVFPRFAEHISYDRDFKKSLKKSFSNSRARRLGISRWWEVAYQVTNSHSQAFKQ